MILIKWIKFNKITFSTIIIVIIQLDYINVFITVLKIQIKIKNFDTQNYIFVKSTGTNRNFTSNPIKCPNQMTEHVSKWSKITREKLEKSNWWNLVFVHMCRLCVSGVWVYFSIIWSQQRPFTNHFIRFDMVIKVNNLQFS